MEQQQTTHSVTILFTNHYSHILCKFVTSNSFWSDHLSLPPFPKASLPSRLTLRTAPLYNRSISPRAHSSQILQLLTSAAAIVVNSAFVSYAGATSTISAETMWRPSKPLRIVRNSRVDQPPVSGVPVAGAKAGSIESICEYCVSYCPHSYTDPKIHSHRWKDKRACHQRTRGSF